MTTRYTQTPCATPNDYPARITLSFDVPEEEFAQQCSRSLEAAKQGETPAPTSTALPGEHLPMSRSASAPLIPPERDPFRMRGERIVSLLRFLWP